jgi:hypothetical protein
MIGGCHRGDTRAYYAELDGFRGATRVWILMSHSIPQYRERDDLLRYLDAIGHRIYQFVALPHVPAGAPEDDVADAYLFDLSTPSNATASAATFPVSNSAQDARFGC